MKIILAAAILMASPTWVGAQGFHSASINSHSGLRAEQPLTVLPAMAREPNRATNDGQPRYHDDAGERHDVDNGYVAALDQGYESGSARFDRSLAAVVYLRDHPETGHGETGGRLACGPWAWEPVIGRGWAC